MKLGWMILAVAVAAGRTSPAQMAGHEQHEHKASAPSTSLVVTVDGTPHTLSLAELQAMPQRTVKVHNGHTDKDEEYSGVGVSDLLAKYGLTLENGGAKRVYHSYLRLEGTDKYVVLYSASEVQPGLRDGDAIVALNVGGKPLGESGQFEMVITGEKKPARWVRNLSSITVASVE